MRVITLDLNKIVTSVKNVGENCVLETNDLVSDIGEVGQIQQSDGSFITPTPTPTASKPTLEQQVAKLQQDNITLMDAIANLYEGLSAKGSI